MIELPGEYGVSATFNVTHLSPFYEDEGVIPSLRLNFSQEGENVVDEGIASSLFLCKDTNEPLMECIFLSECILAMKLVVSNEPLMEAFYSIH